MNGIFLLSLSLTSRVSPYYISLQLRSTSLSPSTSLPYFYLSFPQKEHIWIFDKISAIRRVYSLCILSASQQ